MASLPGGPRRRVLLCTAALVSTCTALAAAQQPQFRAAVETVRVDAVVTDGDGNFIDDLRAGEFTLFEDGERREIVTVELVDLASRQVHRVGSEAAIAPNDPPVAATSATGERASDLGAIIFFIDLPGLYFKNSADFADSMERLFTRTAQLNLPYAIYLVDMAGRLRELQPLTNDREALRQAAETARATTSPVFLREYLFGALDAGEGGAYRADRGEARGRTLYTYGLLRDFVDSLAHRAGRTALVWVSTGVDLAAYENVARPYALLGQQDPTPGAVFRTYNPDLKVLDLQDQLHRAANSANVSIYAVDPTTLADLYLTGGGTLKRRDGTADDARGNSLRNAAHATGGDVFIGWSELDRVLQAIERDAERFYLISYVPPEGGEGEYHEIRVEVSRRGADVRARRGYVRYAERDRLSRTVRSALDLPGTVSGFDVVVQGVRAREADGQALLVVDTAVRLAAPRAGDIDSPGDAFPGMRRAGSGDLVDGRSLLVFSTVRNADGELVTTVEDERLTAPPAGDVKLSAAADPPVRYWTHRAAHRLPSGDYTVSVAILDPSTGRVGAAKLEVEINDAAGEWDISDPWLAAEAPDGSTLPVIGGRVPEGRRVFVYVEVYNGSAPTVGGRVVPFSGDDADLRIADAEVDDAAAANRRGPSIALTEANGVHRASVPLTALPAGSYLLDFYIDDPGAGRSKAVRLPLEVVAVIAVGQRVAGEGGQGGFSGHDVGPLEGWREASSTTSR